MTTGTVPHMLERASDHQMVALSQLLESGPREPPAGPHGPSLMYGSMHAEMACVSKTNNVVQQAKMCKTPNAANAWDAAHSRDVTNKR